MTNPTDKLRDAVAQAVRVTRGLPSVKNDPVHLAVVDSLVWLIGTTCADADDKFDPREFLRLCGYKGAQR